MNPKFNVYTGLLKAFEGPDGEKRFRTTASSTITDLAGDEILPAAIEKMAAKANGNLTIFLNHEYRVPEDVLGSVEATQMQTRGVDGEGNPIVDLDFDIRLNQSNPRALQTWDAIKSGTKLGTSIGALIRHAEKKKGGGLRIDDLELLEASIVGIPANPRSWVQNALKSIKAVNAEELETTFQIDEETVLIDEAQPTIVGEAGPEVVEVLKAMCPDCGKGKDSSGCSNGYHKDSPEPDLEADAEPDKEARTRVTVTVDEGTQEAPKSNPESVLADETAEGDDELLGDNVTRDEEPEKTTDFAFEASQLEAIVKQFQAALTENEELRAEKAKAIAERDEAQENFLAAKAIVDKIADLPIGRKTRFTGPVKEFRAQYGSLYDEEFIKFLEK